MTNYYDVLGVSPTISRDDLKRQYHNLVRQHHPDKASNGSSKSFHQIDEAWKVLGDEELRQKYDAELKSSESIGVYPVQEEIKLSDLKFNAECKQYEKMCRCGGQLIVDESDICDGLLLVDCDNCSLNIIVDCDTKNFNKATSL